MRDWIDGLANYLGQAATRFEENTADMTMLTFLVEERFGIKTLKWSKTSEFGYFAFIWESDISRKRRMRFC